MNALLGLHSLGATLDVGALVRATSALLQVLLMSFLGVPELFGLLDFRNNWLDQCLLVLLLGRQRDLVLLLILVIDARAILRTNVVFLAVE